MASPTLAEPTRIAALAGIALALCMAGAHAQVYKWKDAKGVTHYGDTAPRHARAVQLAQPAEPARPDALPYEVARAARSSPVTLYTTAGCGACDAGRSLLRERGIPFAEKTVSSAADQQRLQEAGSDGKLPLLVVGRDKLVGFEAGAWNDALSAAAYPARSQLPLDYRNRAAEAAAVQPAPPGETAPPAESAAQDRLEAEAQAAARARRPPPNMPPDFQF